MYWRQILAVHIFASLVSLAMATAIDCNGGAVGCNHCGSSSQGLAKCAKCLDGYGFNANGVCILCRDPLCQSCHFDFRECNRCELGAGLSSIVNHRGVWTKTCQRCRDEHCVYCGENAYQCMTCQDGYAPVFGEWVCREKYDRDAVDA